jgi:hypothetical protein
MLVDIVQEIMKGKNYDRSTITGPATNKDMGILD